jgi:hypothetical protein
VFGRCFKGRGLAADEHGCCIVVHMRPGLYEKDKFYDTKSPWRDVIIAVVQSRLTWQNHSRELLFEIDCTVKGPSICSCLRWDEKFMVNALGPGR